MAAQIVISEIAQSSLELPLLTVKHVCFQQCWLEKLVVQGSVIEVIRLADFSLGALQLIQGVWKQWLVTYTCPIS